MTIQIKHAFTSAKGDGGDATLVRPSNWNASHTTSMASGFLLGRLTAGPGSFEEIAVSSYMATALAAADASALLAALGIGAYKAGDIKISIDGNAETGWVVLTSSVTTIGKAGSGATYAAADAWPLFNICYTGVNDAGCPVSGGRTGNALNDFNAGKTITLPWFSGRAIVGQGGGGGLSTRTVGLYAGNETHTLVTGEMPSHYHSAGISDPTHLHNTAGAMVTNGGSSTGGGGFPVTGTNSNSILAAATGVRVNSSNGIDTTYSTGGGGAHNNMMPFIPMFIKAKL